MQLGQGVGDRYSTTSVAAAECVALPPEVCAAVPVIVTLTGWLTLLKGVVFVGLVPVSPTNFYLLELHYAQLYYFYAVVSLAVGAYLTYAGFKLSTHSSR